MTKASLQPSGRSGRVACAILVASLLGGCSSTSMDSNASLGLADSQVALPASAPTPEGRQATSVTSAVVVPAGAPASAPRVAPVAEGPVDTGTFPNLNVPPKTAAPQLSASDKASKQAEIRANQRGQAASAGPSVRNETSELARLGATHANKTLKEIEDSAAAAKKVVPEEPQ